MRALLMLALWTAAVASAPLALGREGRLRRTPKPRWAVELESTASFVHSPSGPLGEDRPDALRFDRIEYGHEPWDALGGRGALAYRWATGWRAEVRAAYIEEMGDGSLEGGRVTYAPSAGVTPFTFAQLGVGANLFRTQANVWKTMRCSRRLDWELGGGLRLLSFEERATASFLSTFPGLPEPAFLESNADNLFVGLQAGLGLVWRAAPCVTIRTSLMAIAGPSWRDVAVRDTAFFTLGTKRVTGDFVSLALGGAFEVTLQWRLTRWLSVTAGYEALVVTDIQRADDAFDFSRGTTGAVQLRDNTDTLASQTVALGLRFEF